MGQWTIEGSDAGTGLTVRATIEAADSAMATLVAREHGIFVATINPLIATPPTSQPAASDAARRRNWLNRLFGRRAELAIGAN